MGGRSAMGWWVGCVVAGAGGLQGRLIEPGRDSGERDDP